MCGEIEIECGIFSGIKPKQVANKAFMAICKSKLTDNEYFKIVETTPGSRLKTYYYYGKRNQLDEPFIMNVGNNEVCYKFCNNITKSTQEEYEKQH